MASWLSLKLFHNSSIKRTFIFDLIYIYNPDLRLENFLRFSCLIDWSGGEFVSTNFLLLLLLLFSDIIVQFQFDRTK